MTYFIKGWSGVLTGFTFRSRGVSKEKWQLPCRVFRFICYQGLLSESRDKASQYDADMSVSLTITNNRDLHIFPRKL